MSVWHYEPEDEAPPRPASAAPPVERDDPPLAGGAALLEGLRRLDLVLLGSVAALTLLGIWALTGATQGNPSLARAADRQFLWLGVALCALGAVLLIDYRWLGRIAPAAYALNLGLLVAVLVVGAGESAARWFRFGPVSFQPTETMKVATVLVLAQWWAHRPEGARSLRDLAVPAAIAGIPAVLILRQPDLGSALLFGVIFLAMLLWAGVRSWILWLMGIGAALMAAGMYPFLRNYQKERILTFLDPSRDPLNAGYQVIQSMVAVGAGGLWGQGWGQGTQAVHRYLPEAHTDFIFAALVEQAGLIGALAVFVLYGVVFWRLLSAVRDARDRFGAFIVVGLAAALAGHVGVNIGMNLGLAPITGLPLPFISYGGSFLVSSFLVVGLVLNVSMRRFVFTRSG